MALGGLQGDWGEAFVDKTGIESTILWTNSFGGLGG